MAAIPPNPRISVPPSSPGGAKLLNANQATFAQELAAQTGLNVDVVAAWLLAEEPASAHAAPWGANNWLNIGGPSVGPGIAHDQIWNDPTTAADATAAWIKGQASIPGQGKATSGIQAILHSVNDSPSAQISAIGSSGWGTSESNIRSLFQHVVSQGGLAGGINQHIIKPISNAVNAAGDAAGVLGNVATFLTTPAKWLTILEFIGGAVLVFMALKSLSGADAKITQMATTAAKAAV